MSAFQVGNPVLKSDKGMYQEGTTIQTPDKNTIKI